MSRFLKQFTFKEIKTTDDLAVGIFNKYFTNILFDQRFSTKNTGELAEGLNLYLTNQRIQDFIALLNSDILPEGVINRYYTLARDNLKYDKTGGVISGGIIPRRLSINPLLGNEISVLEYQAGGITRTQLTFTPATNDFDASIDGNNIFRLNSTTGASFFKNIVMSSNRITGLSSAIDINDAINKNQLDTGLNTKLNLTGGALTGGLIARRLSINPFLGNEISSLDFQAGGTTRTQLSFTPGTNDFDALIDGNTILRLNATTGASFFKNIAMSNNRITGLSSAIDINDAINKNQLDTGLNTKLNLSGGTITGDLTIEKTDPAISYKTGLVSWKTSFSSVSDLFSVIRGSVARLIIRANGQFEILSGTGAVILRTGNFPADVEIFSQVNLNNKNLINVQDISAINIGGNIIDGVQAGITETTNLIKIGALQAGSITTGFGNINNKPNTITTGNIIGTNLTLDGTSFASVLAKSGVNNRSEVLTNLTTGTTVLKVNNINRIVLDGNGSWSLNGSDGSAIMIGGNPSPSTIISINSTLSFGGTSSVLNVFTLNSKSIISGNLNVIDSGTSNLTIGNSNSWKNNSAILGNNNRIHTLLTDTPTPRVELICGNDNIIEETGEPFAVIGDNNLIQSRVGDIILGTNITPFNDHTLYIGSSSTTALDGSTGSLINSYAISVLNARTINNTPTTMKLKNNSAFKFPSPAVHHGFNFEIKVVGLSTAGTVAVNFRGLISRRSNQSGGIPVINASLKERFTSDISITYDASLAIGSTDITLDINVVGDSAITTNWTATIMITHVL